MQGCDCKELVEEIGVGEGEHRDIFRPQLVARTARGVAYAGADSIMMQELEIG